ncbi:MAG: peptidoglycan editing factor PgeF [Oscillatoria sp. SIO1A7]|nr:peptidoglycan editing factor PgeF [Oscillatoria sp. SIO1A7]
MHAWNWQTWNEMPYLTCSLLEEWRHGFFTRLFSPLAPIALVEVLEPDALAYRVKQIHSNIVLGTNEIGDKGLARQDNSDGSHAYPEADGLLAEKAKQAVWVASADCSPVLIAEKTTGKVAAVHSGWRGTAAEIVPKAIARFQEAFPEISLDNLRIAIGPAIAGEVYQVSEEVAAEVCSTIIKDKSIADLSGDKSILQSLQEWENPPVLPDPEPGRVRLDVPRTIYIQLMQLGISPEQVAIAPHCTYQTPESFFSYRRDRLKKVQWSGIVSL